eukprot:11199820-Alexandrium_andersonii.AAC.1
MLQQWCAERGFVERVGAPTRGPHLLDLVLTDVAELTTTSVHAKISDHDLVLVKVASPPLKLER